MVLTPRTPEIQSVPQKWTILPFGVGTLTRTPSSQHKPVTFVWSPYPPAASVSTSLRGTLGGVSGVGSDI